MAASDILKEMKIMRIVILQGSPNLNGSTAMLAKAFAQGAGEAGHEVITIHAARANVHPCTGCVSCGYEGPCVQKDGMERIRQEILASDMLVFATPLYYYGMTAQLKIVVDRFCSFNSSLNRKHLKSALLTVAWNSSDWTFDTIETHYKTLVRYLNLDDQGEILGYGCGTPSMTKHSGFVEKAYQFGASLD
jgi:multimeric flavodoxin WrbA